MGVMSGAQIIEARHGGSVVIEPFNEENVNGASVDVTLGPHFYRITKSPGVFNPYDRSAVDAHFKYKRAEGWISLAPGERILGHTEEFIGMKRGGTTEMAARSTWGRNGISVCLCAGWGDPGYFNRWTMEIQNHNGQSTILKVGTRIAQIVFHKMAIAPGDYSFGGKYQSEDDVETLKKTWVPSMMLPQAYNDKD